VSRRVRLNAEISWEGDVRIHLDKQTYRRLPEGNNLFASSKVSSPETAILRHQAPRYRSPDMTFANAA